MINKKHQLGRVVLILTLFAIAATNVWAQGRGPRFAAAGQATQATRDPLAFLKQALTKAGATALDSSQETALNTLITNFRSANKPTPDPNEQAVRQDYANAILAGNLSTATTDADKLAGFVSARQSAMLKAEADFQIKALSYLSSGQITALGAGIGKNGILRVLQSLTGPGPGFGRGMRGQGPPPNRS